MLLSTFMQTLIHFYKGSLHILSVLAEYLCKILHFMKFYVCYLLEVTVPWTAGCDSGLLALLRSQIRKSY